MSSVTMNQDIEQLATELRAGIAATRSRRCFAGRR